ncbi:MAG: 3-isopropylmalate dehydrogenase [Clostridia bacterium]|nr:3-isopropylmalate dehydrogenase [Clostridia bacterium]
MKYNIAVISGDGIGPDIIREAKKVLSKVGEKYGHAFLFNDVLAGGCAIDQMGECLPIESFAACESSDSILFGAVGGPKWDSLPSAQRPEQALLQLRKRLDLYANLRPAVMFSELAASCPLKAELVEGGLDVLIVRELTGGIYFGEKGTKDTPMGKAAYDVEIYSEGEIKRIAKVAFEAAMKRGKKLTSVDKANVLESSRLWRKTVNEMSLEYPDVSLSHMYIDNAVMQMVRDPKQFDVILTGNMFGDILSDEASMITGSIGMLPSASLSSGHFGMYEPIHGSAPDIAGLDQANPMATILSAAMMLRYSFNLIKEAEAIEYAVESVLSSGYRTPDIMSDGKIQIGTKQAGDLITAQI